jgi:hypothetical protein
MCFCWPVPSILLNTAKFRCCPNLIFYIMFPFCFEALSSGRSTHPNNLILHFEYMTYPVFAPLLLELLI